MYALLTSDESVALSKLNTSGAESTAPSLPLKTTLSSVLASDVCCGELDGLRLLVDERVTTAEGK